MSEDKGIDQEGSTPRTSGRMNRREFLKRAGIAGGVVLGLGGLAVYSEATRKPPPEPKLLGLEDVIKDPEAVRGALIQTEGYLELFDIQERRETAMVPSGSGWITTVNQRADAVYRIHTASTKESPFAYFTIRDFNPANLAGARALLGVVTPDKFSIRGMIDVAQAVDEKGAATGKNVYFSRLDKIEKLPPK